jgi:hypothetical protein
MSGLSFFNAYEYAWMFWFNVAMGSMALTMMHHLTGGDWGVLIRPITTAAMRTLPVMFVLFLPLLLGLRYLFPWARPEEVATDPILRHIHPYLNPAFFILRYLAYFAIWIAMSWGLTHLESESLRRRLSAGGLVAYVAVMTLAGVDWIMSREPHWLSSVFGFILVVSQSLSALCFAIIVLWHRLEHPRVRDFAKPSYFIDLGNMVLMFVILWAYMNFAQFLIIWTGNEQADVAYYVQRTYGGWRFIAGVIIFIHFLVPLVLLLFRDLKKDPVKLALLCAALFALRILDLYWHMAPLAQNDVHGGFRMSAWDILLFLLIGAGWLAAFNYFIEFSPDLAFSAESEVHGTSQAQSL